MAEAQAMRDIVQELLRIELEQFGLQIKDILCQAIREELSSIGSESLHRRKRSPRFSTSMGSKNPMYLRMQSIVSQMSMLNDVPMQQGIAGGSRVRNHELEHVSNEQNSFLMNSTAADVGAEESVSDQRFLLPMRVSEPPTSPTGSKNPVASWRSLMLGHKDSYRQLELMPQRVDSSHQSLLDDLEDELFLEEEGTEDSRMNPAGPKRRASRSATLLATQRIRSENNAWQSETDSIWGNRHRRGHEFQESMSRSAFDGGLGGTWKWMKAFVNGSLWARVTGAMVVLNAIEIGFQADYEAVTWTTEIPAIFVFLEKGFCVFFVLELLLRACILGLSEFFCTSGQWHYNLFDLVMVVLQVTDTMRAFPTFLDDTVSHLSTFRMLRLTRILRLARILHLVSELRMLIISISHSVRNLGWVVLLLLLMIYVLAVYLTQIVTDFKVLHKEVFEQSHMEQLKDILTYYGSVDRSVLSLYAMVSEGIHWRELSDPLAEHISPWISVLFSFFSAFAFLAVMNVVTGVFVESAIHTAAEDKRMTIASQLGDLFKQSDEDGSGTISWGEFQAQLSSTQMKNCLKEVDVDPADAEELFRLLDIDRSGSIDVEELVNGTMRFMGYAKAIDLATFMQEYRANITRWVKHARCVEECLVALLSDWANESDDERE